MHGFWHGFFAGWIVAILPSLVFLTITVTRARELPHPRGELADHRHGGGRE